MDKGLSAAATLFIKRLATLVLKAFLLRNGSGRPVVYRAALRVASGEWSFEDVYKWLRRAQRGG